MITTSSPHRLVTFPYPIMLRLDDNGYIAVTRWLDMNRSISFTRYAPMTFVNVWTYSFSTKEDAVAFQLVFGDYQVFNDKLT